MVVARCNDRVGRFLRLSLFSSFFSPPVLPFCLGFCQSMERLEKLWSEVIRPWIPGNTGWSLCSRGGHMMRWMLL